MSRTAIRGKGTRPRARAPKTAPPERTPPRSSRELLLQAAVREFAEKGYEGATTVAIAERAGVTQQLVHHHFATKHGLWNAAIDALFTPLFESIGSIAKALGGIDAQTRMRVLLRQLVLLSAERPEIAMIMTRESGAPSARLRYVVETYIRPLALPLVEAAEAGIAEGWMKKLPLEHVTFVILGAVSHFFTVPAFVKLLYGLDVTERAVIDRQVDVTVEALFFGLVKTK